MRVRASAGSSSFRRKPSLEQLQEKSQKHVERLRREAESEAARQQGDERRQAAAERAARERKDRIDEALRQHERLSKQREKRKKGDGEKTRVSTTDPDARKMKMANGGYDPAYNVQFAQRRRLAHDRRSRRHERRNRRRRVGSDAREGVFRLRQDAQESSGRFGLCDERRRDGGRVRGHEKWCRRFLARSNWKSTARTRTLGKKATATSTRIFERG